MKQEEFTYEEPKLRGIFPVPEVLVKEGYDNIGDTFAIIRDPEGSNELKLCFIGCSTQEQMENFGEPIGIGEYEDMIAQMKGGLYEALGIKKTY